MHMGGYFCLEILACGGFFELGDLCRAFGWCREGQLGRRLQIGTCHRVIGGTPRGLRTIESRALFGCLE